MKILICTIKSWNVELAEELQKKSDYEVRIITEKEELTTEAVDAFAPDYVFFPHWSYYIPDEVYEKHQCVVFHMTDLPYGRGGSPLQNLIVRGHKNTKLSAIRVSKELDAGPVYCKEPLSLEGSADEIFRHASDIIFHVMIPHIVETQPVPTEQEGEVVSFKRRTPEMSELQPEMTLEQVYDHIRMLDAEGYPNAYLMLGDKKLSFTKATLENGRLQCSVTIEE